LFYTGRRLYFLLNTLEAYLVAPNSPPDVI